MPPDGSLEAYRSKRNFKKTPEPASGEKKQLGHPIYVIQKHDASHLHYDLRLEVSGVLKSWAIPKGPSTDPRVKRLAMPTDDHPMDYAAFEGIIPEGQYGGGTVMVWDIGTYRNIRGEKHPFEKATMEEAYEQGKVEVWLDGKKLKGGYALIRTGRLAEKRGWLIIKMKDEFANKPEDPEKNTPASALTGRTLEQIKRAAEGEKTLTDF
jgi:bifunctional non-homologous end joining protein LigD